MKYFNNKDGSSIVMAMVRIIQKNKDYISEVDGLIADGDHGVNMNKGFTLCEREMEGKELSFSEALDILSNILISEIGGSMGPIYGTIFMEMSETASGEDAIDGALFTKMLNAALSGLHATVKGEVGDKTLVDTLEPACKAFEKDFNENGDFAKALNAMKAAAKEGMESTKDMVAKFGRSSRLGERSRGVLDAGAVSCELILEAMADEILKLMA